MVETDGMIKVDGLVGDPETFFLDNFELFEDVQVKSGTLSGLMVSGTDVDVMYVRNRSPRQPAFSSIPTSSILGRLYMESLHTGIGTASHAFDAHSYPSPTYVNDLLVKLGMTPGTNALMFAHCSDINIYQDIPVRTYFDHFASMKYPLQTDNTNFEHDRNKDHAIGAIILPPEIVRQLPVVAEQALANEKGWIRGSEQGWDRPIVNASRVFDFLTVHVGTIATALDYGYRRDSLRRDMATQQVNNDMRSPSIGPYLRQLWGVDTRIGQHEGKFLDHVIGILTDRLVELRPLIEEAKGELDLAA